LEAQAAPLEVDAAEGGSEGGGDWDGEEKGESGVEEDEDENEDLRGFEAEELEERDGC
jgi:hypothetical protein